MAVGKRSVAVGGDNYGHIHTGDVHPLQPPALAQALAGLPAAPPDFTGRGVILRQLLDALDPGPGGAAAGGGSAVVVHAVAGMAGVGKTALALVAAHQAMARGWFEGGVFFCDLHGYTPGASEPVEAGAAAGQVLRALGLRPEELPATGDEVLAVYRSVLTELARKGRGVLVVADNAAAAGQVQELVPAQGCHRLLVTSRQTLPLAGQQLDLDVLDEGEAVELLRTALAVRRADDERVDANPGAASELVGLCGGLPLAVQIIAALLATEPERPLAAMKAELADAGERLDALQVDGRESGRSWAVRSAFDLSYRRLAENHPERARLFRLLPSAPGVDVCTEAAAVLDGRGEVVVRRDLRELAAAHLITRGGGERWGMHDLLRLYAGEQAGRTLDPGELRQAVDRLMEHYLNRTGAANTALTALTGQDAGTEFADGAAALAWFDAERLSLVAAVSVGQQTGRYQLAADLAAYLGDYLSWRRHLEDQLAVNFVALACMREVGDRRGEGVALNNLGLALQEVRRFEEAIAAHEQAAAIFREVGDRRGEGSALNNRGNALIKLSSVEEG
ncbi:NB-ARC domain-containing protein, partial [Nonomuraea sp. NPDC055795]